MNSRLVWGFIRRLLRPSLEPNGSICGMSSGAAAAGGEGPAAAGGEGLAAGAGAHEEPKKRVIFGTERVKYAPPPPPPPKGTYPRKPPYWQLRNTRASDIRKGIAGWATAFFALLGGYFIMNHDSDMTWWMEKTGVAPTRTPEEFENSLIEKRMMVMAEFRGLDSYYKKYGPQEMREAIKKDAGVYSHGQVKMNH